MMALRHHASLDFTLPRRRGRRKEERVYKGRGPGEAGRISASPIKG